MDQCLPGKPHPRKTLGALVLGLTLSASNVMAAPANCDKLSALDKATALLDIQNLMGRYTHLGQLRGEETLGELFAMKTEGVSWRTPTGPQGIEAMKSRLTAPGKMAQPLKAGQLHTHSVLSPVIEIAGDGKTAKGVWDSLQPSVENGDDVGVWSWTKYAVDFMKQDDGWKIWHMQTWSVFSTPWNKSITESARERREAAASGQTSTGMGATPAGMAAGSSPAAGSANAVSGMAAAPNARAGWTGPSNRWRYDGVTPIRGPKIPEPYCTFDDKDSYGNIE